ncbi:MAG: heavy metal transport/detoxification protein [Fusobacteria bacterium]|nr:MAG: heavy metal transport/detoxification protein [Fusobacteriota bacterium]KAF0229276.1 MAG: heavy metal transport/detoxification [Fusobacteriota bacterium]
MKKTYRLENLGCANCSAKMEHKISKLKGIEEVTVNFFTGKLLLVVGDNIYADDQLEKEIEKIIKKIEPHVRLKEL